MSTKNNLKASLPFVTAVLAVFFIACGQADDSCKESKYCIKNPLEQADQGFITIKDVPDGNYRVHVRVGSETSAGQTVIRGESRRTFFNNIVTEKGEFKDVYFTINKRDMQIDSTRTVKIKKREIGKLNWDDNITFEFNGENPQVASIELTPDTTAVTIFLCGNSTVVDQDYEPWIGWGQMFTEFFTADVAIANYAESGETASGFIARGRLAKLLTQVKEGDYVFVEFGHNDQKQKGEGMGPYLNFTDHLTTFVNEIRAHKANPVFVTPTQRRSFDKDGKIIETHGEYPNAMHKLAEEINVPLLDLHDYTRTVYETLGVEPSIHAFVHYPANTFPNQPKALADNTHFNPYGGSQVAKCVVYGVQQLNLPIAKYLRQDLANYDPAHPDKFEDFKWYPTPFTETEKPDGN